MYFILERKNECGVLYGCQGWLITWNTCSLSAYIHITYSSCSQQISFCTKSSTHRWDVCFCSDSFLVFLAKHCCTDATTDNKHRKLVAAGQVWVYVCVFTKDRITYRPVYVCILNVDFFFDAVLLTLICSLCWDVDMFTVLRRVLAEWESADSWCWNTNRYRIPRLGKYSSGIHKAHLSSSQHYYRGMIMIPSLKFAFHIRKRDGGYLARTDYQINGNHDH